MSALFRLFCKLMFRPTLLVSEAMCLAGAWRRWDWIDDHVLLGRAPRRGELGELRAAGVGAVVNLCGEFAGHGDALAELEMTQLHLPTNDYTCPSADDLERGLAFVKEQVGRGVKVYIHCKAGRTRAAALALCYLMTEKGLGAEEAFRVLRAARPQVTRSLPRRRPIGEFARRRRGEGA